MSDNDADNSLDQLTRRARRVLWLALDVATHARHTLIEPEHVLVALTMEDGSISQAALRELHIDSDMLQSLLYQRIPPGNHLMDEGTIPFSGHTIELLQMSVLTAYRMGNGFVGTEHLLLTVMEQSRYGVLSMLRECGTTAEMVIRRVRRILQRLKKPSATTQDDAGFYHLVKVAAQEAETMQQTRLIPEHLFLSLYLEEYPPVRSLLESVSLNNDLLREMVRQIYDRQQSEGMDYRINALDVIRQAKTLAADNQRSVMPYDLFFVLMSDFKLLEHLFLLLNINRMNLRQELLRYGIHLPEAPAARKITGRLFWRE